MIHVDHTIPITILICDDDEGDRLLMRQVLNGARVSNSLRFVEDGAQLMDYLYQRGAFAGETGRAPRPGLILVDVDAPMIGALEALTAIHSDPTLSDIPIVGLRASCVEGDERRDDHGGVASFMTRPVTFSGLVQALNVLDRHWLEIVEVAPVAGWTRIPTVEIHSMPKPA